MAEKAKPSSRFELCLVNNEFVTKRPGKRQFSVPQAILPQLGWWALSGQIVCIWPIRIDLLASDAIQAGIQQHRATSNWTPFLICASGVIRLQVDTG